MAKCKKPGEPRFDACSLPGRSFAVLPVRRCPRLSLPRQGQSRRPAPEANGFFADLTDGVEVRQLELSLVRPAAFQALGIRISHDIAI